MFRLQIPRSALALTWLCASLFAQDAARMEEIIRHHTDTGSFTGAVLVARGDAPVLNKGYGQANVEWQIPNTPDTKYRLGSVTKQFTAAAVLLLEQRGKLKVEDPVGKFIPDAPAAWEKITVHHLLSHTSGIPNFTALPAYRKHKLEKATPAGTMALFKDKSLEFEPGSKWAYSNSGYVLLGIVIEKASGESYEKFLLESIFAPLGMKDTGYESNAAILPRRAAGYTQQGGFMRNAEFIDMTVPYAAGALYSTTGDLLRWNLALHSGKLLQPAALRKMTTPVRNGYAYGITLREEGGRRSLEHGGGIEGFNTFLAWYPDDRLTVAVLGNVNGSAPTEIARQLAAIVHGEKVVLPGERKEVPVAANLLAEYAGVYELRPGFDLTVTVEDGKLMTQATGQTKVPVYAESEAKFFLKVTDAQIEFVRDSAGKVTQLVLYQGGGRITARRK